jgi:hypothetical protein
MIDAFMLVMLPVVLTLVVFLVAAYYKTKKPLPPCEEVKSEVIASGYDEDDPSEGSSKNS